MSIRTFAAITAALLSTGASAANFAITGVLLADNGRASTTFNVEVPSTVTLRTFGYAGGRNTYGRMIARGGFDPVLSVYDAAGNAIDFNDDGVGVAIDPTTGAGGDSLLSLMLGVGVYKVFVTQYNNFGPLVLPGAFAFDGQPNFRDGFVDFYGSQRSNAFALDILNVASVPEAGSTALMLAGLGLLGFAARRRNAA